MSKAVESSHDINPRHLQGWRSYEFRVECCEKKDSRMREIIDELELVENAFVCWRTLIVSKG
jgi:hypothetical protein